jgi:hypothetical protein
MARVLAWAALLAIVGAAIYGVVWLVSVTLRESKGKPWLRAGWLSALPVALSLLVALRHLAP